MIFTLATPDLDPQLRALSRKIPIPGDIDVAYTYEPDFFAALGVQGRFSQVIAALDGEELAGFGCRCVRPVHVDGKPADIGYLSGLKALPEYRNSVHLARGFRFLKSLHGDGRAPVYLTTIIEENATARRTLSGGRAGLPFYHDWGRYVTYAVLLNRRRRIRPRHPEIRVETGDAVDPAIIFDFLNAVGRKRQFFPEYRLSDLGTGYLRDFDPGDFYVATRGGGIAGVIAKWDQQAYKQHVITGYHGWIGRLKPLAGHLIDPALRLAGYRSLPQAGERLRMFFVAFVAIGGDSPEVLEALLQRVYADHRDSSYHLFTIGFHESDPLAAALRRFFAIHYKSRLYLVCWDDGRPFARKIDRRRIPYLEPAAL